MAVKELTPKKSPFNEITKVEFIAATSASDGIKFKLPTSDEYVVILIQNTDAGAATIKVRAPEKGNYASASDDLTLELAAGEVASIRVESARYAETDGTVTLIPSKTAVKAAVIY